MAQKLVYTSSPKGLQPGAYGFCVVAATRGLHDRVASFLASTSGYRRVFSPESGQANLNPVSHTHMLVDNLGQTFRILSRVADAGLDYTNRTNKIASFLLPDRNELVSAGPAALFDVPGLFYTSWNQAPTWFEPTQIPAASEPASTLCSEWARVMGAPDWGAALAATVYSGAPVALVYEPGRNVDVLKMFQESIHLLPVNMRWNATFSTYFTQAPLGAQCQWKAVLAGSPEEATMRANPRVVIFDLTRPGGAMPEVGLASPNGAQLLTLARGAAQVATPTAVPVPGGVPFGTTPPSMPNAVLGNSIPFAPQPQGGAAFPPPFANGAPFDSSGSPGVYGIQDFPGGAKPLNYGRDWVQPGGVEGDKSRQPKKHREKKMSPLVLILCWIVGVIIFLAIGVCVVYKYCIQNESQTSAQNGTVPGNDKNKQKGTEQKGTEQKGTEQKGTEQNGTEQEGTEQEGTEQKGTEQKGTEQKGTEQKGTEQKGTEQEGTEPEVTEQEVTEPEVTEPEGMEPDVSEQEDDERSLENLFRETFQAQDKLDLIDIDNEKDLLDRLRIKAEPKVGDCKGLLLFDDSGTFFDLAKYIKDHQQTINVKLIVFKDSSIHPKKFGVKTTWVEGDQNEQTFGSFTRCFKSDNINKMPEDGDWDLEIQNANGNTGIQSANLILTEHGMAFIFKDDKTREYFKKNVRVQFIMNEDNKSPLYQLVNIITTGNEASSAENEVAFQSFGSLGVNVLRDTIKKTPQPPYLLLELDEYRTKEIILHSENNSEPFIDKKCELKDVVECSVTSELLKESKSRTNKYYNITACLKLKCEYKEETIGDENRDEQEEKMPIFKPFDVDVRIELKLNIKGKEVNTELESVCFECTNNEYKEQLIKEDLLNSGKRVFIDVLLVSNEDQKPEERLKMSTLCVPCEPYLKKSQK